MTDAKMVSMKMGKAEAKHTAEPMAMEPPKYPYGLELTLNEEALAKLGIKELPAAETEGHVMAKCYVSRVASQDAAGGKANRSLSLQITDLAFEYDHPKKSADEMLYGG
jgi:hypothetical protein